MKSLSHWVGVRGMSERNRGTQGPVRLKDVKATLEFVGHATQWGIQGHLVRG